jgi:hypothetical protein
MALAGHTTRLKVSGAAVVVAGEATTNLGSNRYQITNTARRIIDPSVAPVVKDGGVAIPAANYTFDYLFGIATLTAPPGGAVTMDVSYLPVATIAEVKAFSFSAENGLVERTSFDSNGARQRMATLLDTSGSLQMLSSPLADIDPVTGGVQSLFTVFTSGTPKLLEAQLGATYLRWWVILKGLEVGSEVAGLVESTANLEGAPQQLGAVYGIGS